MKGNHLNLNVRGLSPSATLAINERSAALQAQGRTIYRLGLGQSPFPVPESVVEELRRHAHEKDYLPVRGLRALRDQVAEFHRTRDGLDCVGDDVLVGPGSKELIFIAQLAYSAELVLPAPSWVSYGPQAQIAGRPVAWLDTTAASGWRLTPETLDAHCASDPTRPRLLILNYPNNPSGMSYGPGALEALADVCRKYQIVVVSDEIYGEVHHRGEHVSLACFYPEGTIVSAGLSKWCGAGGWRLGTFVFPPNLRPLLDAMAVVASETFTSTSAPIQYAAVRAFAGGEDIERYLRDSRRVLAALGSYVARTLRNAGASLSDPEGGFYVLPDFSGCAGIVSRGIQTSAELAERALQETGVAFLPGSQFGRPPRELTARLAYVNFDGGGALAAASQRAGELDDDFLRAHCPGVVDGIGLLADWAR
jgi:aspartate aminotransferase